MRYSIWKRAFHHKGPNSSQVCELGGMSLLWKFKWVFLSSFYLQELPWNPSIPVRKCLFVLSSQIKYVIKKMVQRKTLMASYDLNNKIFFSWVILLIISKGWPQKESMMHTHACYPYFVYHFSPNPNNIMDWTVQ